MVIMNVLRILADVSFFCAFAGPIAAACGGSGAFAGMMIQCICFGLAYLGGARRWLRLVILLPMALGWIIHAGSLADCIFLIPTAAYIIWLVWKGDFSLDQERHQTLFQVFWKVLIGFVLIACLLGGRRFVTAVALPYAVVMLTCSVLLMRALRHDRRVYCQKKYQLINASAVAGVMAVACLISSKTVLNAVGQAIKSVYAHLLRPILELLLNLLLYLIQGIIWLMSLLFSGKEGQKEGQEPIELIVEGSKELFGEETELKQPSELLRMLGILLLIAAVIVLLVLFFRWLSKRRGKEGARLLPEDGRTRIEDQRSRAKQKETTPIRSIRAQYRKLLKLYTQRGLPPEKGNTSLDIHRRAGIVSVDEGVSGQIRELYIKARYAGKADREEAQKMKRLCAEAQKPSANNET